MTSRLYPHPAFLARSEDRVTIQAIQACELPEILSQRLRDLLKRDKRLRPLLPEEAAAVPPESARVLQVLQSGDLKPQGYALDLLPGKTELRVADAPGLQYGLDTLAQWLAAADPNGSVPTCQIEDWPAFPIRAYMQDISRCKVPTLSALKDRIRRLARLRYNQLQLYTEHTFAYADHRDVWAEASPMTGPELRELDRYAAGYGIELVPCLNSLGHFERWLRHRNYRHLAECPDHFAHGPDGQKFFTGTTLCPDDRSLAFVTSLYEEFLPNFSSGWVNIGGDEPWELGKGRSRDEAERKGIGRLYLDFLLGLFTACEKLGKRPMFWGDIINHYPELIPELPDAAVALNWGYEADSRFAAECPRFAAADRAFFVCPGTSSWRSLSGRWDNAQANLALAAKEGLRNGAMGYLVTDWGDGGHHQLEEISWPGMTAGALYAWQFEANEGQSIAEAIDACCVEAPAPGLGRWLCDLGSLPLESNFRRGNIGLFHHLLFVLTPDSEAIEAMRPHLQPDQLQRIIEGIKALRQRAGLFDAPGRSHRLGYVCDLLELAVSRYQTFAGLPVHRADSLKHLQAATLETYPSIWLELNRSGGLDESLDALRSALDF